jgi:hypothetical protein
MDRRIFFLLLFLTLIGIFIFSSKAIIDIKLQELRFYLVKEQLLNYELSSKVLKEKIKQMLLSKDDYTSEIRNNILESNIMNSDTLVSYPKLGWVDYYGLGLVNFVRFVSLKTSLTLVEDQNDMMQIQYAFYMERTRKFSIAAKKYESVSEKFQRAETNENGFVMLHHGFCLAMMGEIEAAIAKLRATEEIFIGTHFADNARVLINVLLEGEKRKENIKTKVTSVEKKAELLYESGNYRDTLETLNQISDRTNGQNYMRARSLEETGQSNAAVEEYINLTKQSQDREVAIKANRRLLLLGNIYEKNESIANYSKQQAEKLGDTEVAKQVEAGSTLVAKSLIVEKLTNQPPPQEGSESGLKPEEFEELKKEFETFKVEEKKEREEKLEKILPVQKEEEIVQQDLLLRFRLIDGKIFEGKRANYSNGKFTIGNGIFEIEIPHENIHAIVLNEPPKVRNFGLLLEKTNGKRILMTGLLKEGERFIFQGGPKDSVDLTDIKSVIIQN